MDEINERWFNMVWNNLVDMRNMMNTMCDVLVDMIEDNKTFHEYIHDQIEDINIRLNGIQKQIDEGR